MRRSMHLGEARPARYIAVAEKTFIAEPIEEEIFNPEAAKTDGNPFPEEEVVEEGLTVEEEMTSQNKIAEMIDEEHPTLLTKETTPLEEEGPTDYNSLTVEELRALCRARDLAVGGKKAELVARLMEADAPSLEAVEVTEDAPSLEAASSDETGSVSNESEPETTDTVG